MNQKAQIFIQKSQDWLTKSVFPLWTAKGIDTANGCFVESLSTEGKFTMAPRRAMVQARQIYAYSEAAKLKVFDDVKATQIIERSTKFLVKNYSLPSDAFMHAVNIKGQPVLLQSELYTQAFVLFGLARAFEILGQTEIKQRAKKLLKYLNLERKSTFGGYTEIKQDEILFQSNPHMHLFEAAIAWVKVDSMDPDWRRLASELSELCQAHYCIDKKTGLLAEHFSQDWQPLRDKNRFVFEPGHHYEWSWLFFQYEKYAKAKVGKIPFQLFALAEKHGLRQPQGLVLDEVWSDFKVKKSSSRFWPQCERIKAALEVGLHSSKETQRPFADAADEAMQALWIYLDAAPVGHWEDTKLESGEFVHQDTKASSLYHIINAMSEYIEKRPLLESKA